MLVKTYAALAAGVLVLYSATGFMGWEMFALGQRKLSKTDHANVRAGRSHFWFSGYHGGK